MLFNSYEFLFIFLPIALAAFFFLGAFSRSWALNSIIVASLCFYAWWRPLNVLIILPTVLINFAAARAIQHFLSQEKKRSARTVLVAGIAFDVAFLGYFKYANFTAIVLHDVFGRNLVLKEIILPLGISFITFQLITFLVDVHGQRIKSFSLRDFVLFVLFFPQLIAGPIVHYREMMPQFKEASCKFSKENASVGLTLFAFGLFKKVVLADSIAPLISPIYGQAALGEPISLVTSWMAAIGFTMQIYFDFCGYTDMALGIARFFGIRLPQNFNSPLRASNIIDFWLRWHITLTRFLTAYIYNPLALSLTRRRLANGKPVFGGRNSTVGAFLLLLAFPTVLTMFISGLWHGAAYTFVVWGLMHGFYLAINHAWRQIGPRLWPDKDSYNRFMTPAGFVITFVSVAASMIVFRAATMGAAGNLLKGMFGLNGVALPRSVIDRLGPVTGVLSDLGVVRGLEPGVDANQLTVWIAGLTFIALVFPNTLEVLARYEPALGVKELPPEKRRGRLAIAWSASPVWAVVLSVIAATGVFYLGGQSEFLYWQF
jgi:D-alanyl-lipoteichoic acid acyltransferase DltB (MBOAT superfamily)